MSKWCGALLALAVVVIGCEEGREPEADPSDGGLLPDQGQIEPGDPGQLNPTFDNVYAHVLEPGCAGSGCHDAVAASGGLDFGSVAAAYATLVGGPDGVPPENDVAKVNGWLRVRAGDFERSFLMRKLISPGLGEGDAMPTAASALTPAWQNLIQRWIVAGAPAATGIVQPMPAPPALTTRRADVDLVFRDPVRACINCHPTHVREWRISNHAYAAKDPVFHAMVQLGQKQTAGKLKNFCVQCHTPPGLALEQTPVRQNEQGDFYQDFSGLSTAAQQGVSCDVCHSITAVNSPQNAQMIITPNGTMRGSIEDPQANDAHESAFSPIHVSGEVCGSCHNVVNPAGAQVEETFKEWSNSSYAQTHTCQDCHMPAYQAPAAVDGPERTVHRHTFVGVDVSLLPPDDFPGYDEMRALTRQLLENAATLDVFAGEGPGEILVTIANKAGHRLPSGATAERQMWLEVLVQDDERVLHFESGTVDDRGDLREENHHHTSAPGTDPQLQLWRQVMLGMDQQPVEFPWQAKSVANRLIEPNATDSVIYDLSEVPPGLYTLQVRLLFRTFPPYFMREMEDLAGLDPTVKSRVPVVEMQRLVFELEVPGEPPVDVARCSPDRILDCNQNCQPLIWLGDGECEDGTFSDQGGPDFQCAALNYDDGDCEAPSADPNCPVGQITDCVGVCWTTDWLADGWCDDGTVQEWGDPDFQCEALRWDAGDCEDPNVVPEDRPGEGGDLTPEGCLTGFIRDCAGECRPNEWLGDGNCDNGTNSEWGNPDFNCAAYSYDNRDCAQ